MPDAPTLQEYPEDPQGWASRWAVEIQAARKHVERWWERAEKIVQRYVDDRTGSANTKESRLNLFTANTQTMESLLYGRTPEVSVARRFADSADDQARVAAEMLERLLNTDLERDDDTQEEALKHALADRLRVGLGNVRLRYEIGETEAIQGTPATDLAPAVPDTERRKNEYVCVDYPYWKDQLWSPCRTYGELRWWAFGADMSEEQFKKRFGEKALAAWSPTDERPRSDAGRETESTQYKDPTKRCRVWEIWSKERKTVDWYVEGYTETLDHKDDPLGLENFWPFPRPMFANLVTAKLLPTPDYYLAQDLYDEIDTVSTRITLLEQVISARGVYDKNNDGIKRLISEAAINDLIGVDAWAAFAERGGVKGAIDWLPLEMVVGALDKLREYRTELIGLLYQITGMSDIMRGQAQNQSTATEQAIKARFASVRVQSMQDEFARFCSDTQKIKAEIIAKHFQSETIIERSNVMMTPDAQLAIGAVQLIKSPTRSFRVTVNPDSVSLQDYAALKQERFEWLQAISQFFQIAQPIAQAMPGSMPFLLQLAQWTLAGMKGSNEIEGVFDQAIEAAKRAAAQPPPPAPPDPKVQAATVKAGAEQFKAKADMAGTVMDLQVAKQKHVMEMQKMAMQMQQSQTDHVQGIQSQEAKARAESLAAVNKVTTEGPT
jgi:hypothetical protein